MITPLTKPRVKFEKPTWPKPPVNNIPTHEEVEKVRENNPANVEGSKEFNEANKQEEPIVDSAGFTEQDRKETQSEFDFKQFKSVEPLKNNRFLITLNGAEIPQYFFRKYEMYNEGDQMIFTTEFLESILYTFNPKDFFSITSVKLDYLDPVGEVVGGLNFDVKGSNFYKNGDYGDDSLQTTHLKFVVDVDTIHPHFIYK